MNITKEQSAKTTVLLRIELLGEELKPYITKAADRISKEIKISGFRPGHVPYDILKSKIGEMEIYQEVAQIAIADTLPTAAQREQIDFIGQPKVAVEQLAPGNPLVYTATFALMPTVHLNNYKTVKVKREPVKFDEKKYQRALEELRKMQAKTTTVQRSAKTGDRVELDFSITLAGVPIEGGQGKKVPVVLGEYTFVPGFEEQLVGMQAGETKKFNITFPKDYGTKQLAGKECAVTATVQSVHEVQLPTLDDSLAKALNFNSLQELEAAIKKNITQELEQKIEDKFEVAVIEVVVKQAEFDPIPELMVTAELDRMMNELKHEVEYQGAKFSDYLQHVKQTETALKESWQDKAEQRIKSALVLKTVGEQEKIEVSEEDINAEIKKYTAVYKDSPKMLKRIDSLDFRSYLRTTLRNTKAMQKLKEYAAK